MLNTTASLRVAILCSHRAPGIEALLERAARAQNWEIACAVTSELELRDNARFEQAGVPVVTQPVRQLHKQCGAPLGDMEVRRSIDALTLRALRQYGVQMILLLGYLYVVTDVLLAAFPDRVLNIHDSDLAREDSRGVRRFTGLHATRDAVLAGELETRSTLHLVTPSVDEGPVLIRSKPYPVARFALEAARAGHRDIVNAYAFAQREWMMRDSWSDMAAGAIESIAASAAPAARLAEIVSFTPSIRRSRGELAEGPAA